MLHKTKFKGMTLVEIMVAIFVAGLIALLMVEVMNCVNATMRATSNLNKRLAYEGKVADNLQTSDADMMTDTELANYSVTIKYDNDSKSLNVGNTVTPTSKTIRVAEYTGKYDDTNYSGAQANYHFMIASPFEYQTAERPFGVFLVRLIIDGDVRTIDALQYIEMSGGLVDCTFTWDNTLTGNGIVGGFYATAADGTVLREGAAVPTRQDPAPGGGTVTVADFTLTPLAPGSSIKINGSATPTSGAYAIDIPVRYPLDSDIILNPATAGRGMIDVNVNMLRTSTLSPTLTKDYDFSTMHLDYCTGAPFTLPDGTDTVQFYPSERQATEREICMIGATYNLHKDGSVTVLN